MNIIIAGDYSPISTLQDALDADRFEQIFGEVRPIIEKSDYAIVNFESTVADESCSRIQKSGPHLKTNIKAIEGLKYAGFKCATLANNHFRDYGNNGVQKSIEVLTQMKLDHVGGGTNLDEASRTLYKPIGDRLVAIINACEHEFSIADEINGGSNPLDLISQYNSIAEARATADYVIVIIHGGHELYNLPSLRMKKTYRFFVDAGADAVINHHQHCWSGYEVYHGKPIFYGLGNFCFPNMHKVDKATLWNYGYMVNLIIETKDINFETIPYLQCDNDSTIRIIDDKSVFSKQLHELNEIIQDDKELFRRQSAFYSGKGRRGRLLWEPYGNKILKALYLFHLLPSLVTRRSKKLTMFYNLLNCEAHKDKMMYILHECLR